MPQRNDLLDEPVLSLSNSDYLLLRDVVEGTLITGAPGSGKSSCSGRQLAIGLLRIPGMGGLVLTAKGEEKQNWINYTKACGRQKDLLIFSAESGHVFDPIFYEFSRPGRGAGDAENVIEIFTILQSLGKQHSGSNNERFWEQMAEKLERHAIKTLELASEPITISNMNRVIESLPTRPGEFEEQAWQKESYVASLIQKIRERKDTLTGPQWSDLDVITRYLLYKWPSLDDRPRSSVEAQWSGMCDKFLFDPFNRLFSGGKCSFTPEQAMREGKIVLIDFPILEYAETGTFINVMMKLIFQRAWLRRDVNESPNPNFCWMDEFQYFVTKKDNFFQQTCRGSRVAVVCLTQNILNLSETLGENQPGSKTKSFLGNLATHIYHQQNEIETCNYAADKIGREYRYLDNYNTGTSGQGQQSHAGVGGSQQLVHILEPVEFTRLLKPTATNPLAQAIVYQSKPFNATKTPSNPKGRNYLSVYFSRE